MGMINRQRPHLQLARIQSWQTLKNISETKNKRNKSQQIKIIIENIDSLINQSKEYS